LNQLDVTLWKFFIAQHVSNAITFILRSWRLHVGVLLCFGVCWCIGTVRLELGGIRMQVGALRATTTTNTPADTEIEQYTHMQSPAPEDECNSIRNMLSNKKLP